MPLIPAGLSSFNEKVESARKGFNSTLDKAGQKSGVFKGPANSKTASASVPPQSLPPPVSARPPPPYTRPSPAHPPPPPPARNRLGAPPPPPTRQLSHPPPPPPRQPSNPPPPPSRANVHHVPDQTPYEPAPPPVARKPIAIANTPPYRPPPSSINGYGPPNMAPVQTTSRYGPPSPPRSSAELHEESIALESHNSEWPQQSYPDEPPSPIRSSKPTNWQQQKPASAQPNHPPRYLYQKTGQIPFPPFSQFTQQDKEVFFDMLDEFFNRRFPDRKLAVQSVAPHHLNKNEMPPLVSLQTRPSIAAVSPQDHDEEPCRAELIARYFKTYRQWTSAADHWFLTDDPVPTPMQGADDVKRVSCWTQTGNERTQMNYVLFPDLSQLWTEVRFDVSRAGAPRHAAARFRPPPGLMDRHTLIGSAETYGPQLVAFAENAERSRRHVARGECWDMANEALKAFPTIHPHPPAPLTSISRTHGIMLYYGRATGPGSGYGSWKQPSDLGAIRPGDIIEWRLVACETVNPSLSFTLGDPDHTAIIVDASGCTVSTSRSPDACPPTLLGLITVVEQSLKQLPIRRTYNLATISRGEVWIYRPMAEDALLGPGRNECSFPPPNPAFEPS